MAIRLILFLVRCTVGKREASALLERDDGVLGGRAAERQGELSVEYHSGITVVLQIVCMRAVYYICAW